jgi:hypothetical protein
LVCTCGAVGERRRPKSASSALEDRAGLGEAIGADHSASARLLLDAAVVGDEAAQLLEHGDGAVERAESVAEDRRGLVEDRRAAAPRVDVIGGATAAARLSGSQAWASR